MQPIARLIVVSLLAISTAALAIVRRPGVPDARYRVERNALPALVNLPGEGHGALIAPQWVVTAGHATLGYDLKRVWIHSAWRTVDAVITYPGFKQQFAAFRKQAQEPTLAHWKKLHAGLEGMHDIALVHLRKPVTDVRPLTLYRDRDETGKVVQIFGAGATGDGRVGQYPHAPHRGELRRAYNRITRAHAQWLDYRFDCGKQALPLEGVLGDGDSGGPVLIRQRGEWKLAGLADWKHWPPGARTFRAGVCGQTFSNSRIAYYADWINRTLAAHAQLPSR
ncbi:hypothetical protein GCM10027285_09590 [Oleiagrimonas citrea]|uniref:Trypsin-like serine protease n=1 Tax=Oleiagrimonas citrea TaxID=1665687 RepID=A0A846ZLZ7_9GAMM|nr:trypsin-like serine protease [Oleiagrimonas citrea]